MTIQGKNRIIQPEEYGLWIAKTCGWDGHVIFKAAIAALEDANFHTARAELIRAWESVEGPLYD
jgi:hypothetical protein